MAKTSRKHGYLFRKIIHLILNVIFAITALLLPPEWIIPVTLSAFCLVTVVELIRLQTRAKKMVNDAFKPVLKKEERGRFSGIFWSALAIALVAPIATPVSLSYALATFALADPAAAIIGKYTKSKKIHKNKTINGTTGFFLASIIVGIVYGWVFSLGLWFIPWVILLAFILSIVEVFSDPIDDNFSLVVVGALFMTQLI